jgi:amino acid adenylation domain-containing protein
MNKPIPTEPTSDHLAAKKLELLALMLAEEGLDDTPSDTIRPGSASDPKPLSFAQQRLWFLDQLDPGKSVYNISSVVRAALPLNVQTLERSLNDIIARHEILRTTFAIENGQPIQVVVADLHLAVPVVDLSRLTPAEREETARKLAAEEAQRPFDLSIGPLLRCTMLRLDASDVVLVITLHHIVSDNWSTGIFIREMATNYLAYSLGQTPKLPPLPIQYADFARWQRETLQGKHLETLINAWRARLDGAPTYLPLPTDWPRPRMQTFSGAKQTRALPAALTTSLYALSRANESTLFMLLETAFAVWLRRLTNQTDLLIGTPIANRTRAEVNGLIGFFVNTLVLRADLRGTRTFREALARTRATALDAYAHQDLPFEQLVQELQVERALSYTPLFQVMFVLQSDTISYEQESGLAMEVFPIENHTTKFDLTLYVVEMANGLLLSFEYNTDLFRDSTIVRWLAQYETLLQGIVCNPDQRIVDLPLMSAAEERQVLVEWNATAADYSTLRSLQQIFEEQVTRTPDAVAVQMDDHQLSYRVLNARANQLAHVLRRLGVGPEVLVGLFVERSLEMMIGLLGIIKAGGAYVPLDPAFPPERIAFMLADTSAPVLLTQRHLVPRLPEHAAQVICLDEWDVLNDQPAENPTLLTTPEHLLYVIYTSGSTGKPKGVAMCHRALLSLIPWQITSTDLPANNRTIQFSSLNFDVSYQEMFATWGTGGTLVALSEAVRRDSVELARCLRRQAIQRMFLPFVALQHLAEVAESVGGMRLREVIAAGEQLRLTPSIVKWLSSMPGCTLYNQYGPSENHIVTSYTCEGPADLWPKLPPIGRPISNAQMYVLDMYMQPVPIGIDGELYIGGENLARGYLHRPDITAEKFVSNPFGSDPGARLYRTGDRVRYLPDGNIEFLERIDHQVKIRGFRIELGEIEVVLSQHLLVREAAVVVRESSSHDKRLAAYVVPHRQQHGLAEVLRLYLLTKLPEYMVPAMFVLLDHMPLTPSGKIDRKALPDPVIERALEETAFVAARTPTEEVLVGIWSSVLELEQISTHNNFFELGGHSLLATQVISRVRDAFRVDLEVRRLFELPTVGSLASYIDTLRQGVQLPPIQPVPRDGTPLPLSFAQQRLWFLDQLDPGNAAYNVAGGIRLRGAFASRGLEIVLNRIIQRHEALRTSFDIQDGTPSQIIAPELFLMLPVIDLSGLAGEEREQAVRQIAHDEALQPFDLRRSPLARFTLLRLCDDDHVLLLTMHHIIADGWSLGVFVREIAAFSAALAASQPLELDPLPVQYADFAVWQRQWFTSTVLEAQLNYWRIQLQGAPARLNLPTSRPRPPMQSFRGATHPIAVPSALAEMLRDLSRRNQATLFITLLSVFKVLMFRYSGQEDIVVGTNVANRNRSEIEGLIGFFVNMLALRTNMGDNPSFLSLLARVRETSLAAYDHQDLPFEQLVQELQVERSLSHSPIFQVVFSLQNAPMPTLNLPGLTISPFGSTDTTSKFDLVMNLWDTGDGLIGALEYNSDLFEQPMIARMVDHFQSLLVGVTDNPKSLLKELVMLSADEQAWFEQAAHVDDLDDNFVF